MKKLILTFESNIKNKDADNLIFNDIKLDPKFKISLSNTKNSIKLNLKLKKWGISK